MADQSWGALSSSYTVPLRKSIEFRREKDPSVCVKQSLNLPDDTKHRPRPPVSFSLFSLFPLQTTSTWVPPAVATTASPACPSPTPATPTSSRPCPRRKPAGGDSGGGIDAREDNSVPLLLRFVVGGSGGGGGGSFLRVTLARLAPRWENRMVSAAPRAVVCVRALQTKFRCFCVQNPPKRFYSSSRVLRGRVYFLRCFFISRSEIPTTRALPSNDDGDERAGVGGATRNPAFRRGFEKKTKVSLFFKSEYKRAYRWPQPATAR